MAVSIDFDYRGNLRTRAVHGPTGGEIITDAPVDNHGKGEAFSPTDLVAASLGTCIITVMAIAANKRGIEFPGAKAHIEKEMISDPRRRIGRLHGWIEVEGSFTDSERALLERVAHTCPVEESLDSRVEVEIEIRWIDAPSD